MACIDSIAAGTRFGRWTVLGLGDESRHGQKRLLCQCECGVVKSCLPGPLLNRKSKSCGCARNEQRRTHGMSNNPVFRAWKGMLRRCNNPKCDQFRNYGARGIAVCDRWFIFQNFYDDMASTYAPKLELERLDNDLGYSPNNCAWVSRSAQNRNRRVTKWIGTSRGLMLAIDIARIVGVREKTISDRVKRGWTGERLFLPPIERHRGRLGYRRDQNAGPHPAAS